MNERWIEYGKKADFGAWAEELGISPLTARLLRNRGILTLSEARHYLNDGIGDLADPLLMKDMAKAADILREAILSGGRVGIVSDFDDDGIFAGEILYEGILRAGGQACLYTPSRMREGYGINRRIIDEAKAGSCSVILTCDNGIAAISEIGYAKSLGLTVIVTDHHEVQYDETSEGRRYLLPPADAVVDPKREDCGYPFKGLCGAGVAFRLIEVLYGRFGIPKRELEQFYEYVAIATVADVVELQGENRILVREGLRRLRETEHIGLRALIEECSLDPKEIRSYHLGFVIGPSFNAVGRIGDVRLAFDLLQCRDEVTACEIAREIRAMNEERKRMTEEGFREAVGVIDGSDWTEDRIYVVPLEEAHESVVGIIAGRLRERYGRPVVVLTAAGEDENGEALLKGSARSIPAYSIIDGLMKAKACLRKFGGHKQAAGLTLLKKDLPELRSGLNAEADLSDEDMRPVLPIDARVPFSYLTEELIGEFALLEPFGTGNAEPCFALPHLSVRSLSLVGKNRNVLRMNIRDESGTILPAVLFREIEEFLGFLRSEFGEAEIEKAKRGEANGIDIALAFRPAVETYRDSRTIRLLVVNYCRIPQKGI